MPPNREGEDAQKGGFLSRVFGARVRSRCKLMCTGDPVFVEFVSLAVQS